MKLKSYFMAGGISLEYPSCQRWPVPERVIDLSAQLAKSYPLCVSFLKYIRSCYSEHIRTCSFCLDELSEREKQATVAVAYSLFNCGILTDLYIETNNIIHGSFPLSASISNFLSGDFLEIYCYGVIRKLIAEKARQYNTNYEIRNNVIVKRGNQSHELDLLFRIGDKVFWCEVKSGSFSNYEKYLDIGRWMRVSPDKLILLTAEKDPDVCDAIHYFYHYYVSNIDTFPDKLTDMIDQAFSDKKSAG